MARGTLTDTFTINDKQFQITFRAYPSGWMDFSIELEEVIFLDTGCEVELSKQEEETIGSELKKYWEQNYDPTPD